MEKLKINFVIPSTVLGGGVRMVFQYSNYLTERGHDVVVYVPAIFWPNRTGIPNIKTSLANVFKRGTKVPWYYCKFPIKLAVLISDKYIRDADFTFATAWYTAKDVSRLGENKGEKCYFIQDYEVCADGSDREQVEATYSFPLHKITIARWLSDVVYKISGEHATVILNGVDDEEFIRIEKKVGNPKTVIMLGNMAEHKGGRNGLKILQNVQEKYGIRVVVYGSTLIDDFPSTFEFYLRPEREKLMKLYDEADICLFPSIREGWGLIVTEAMAHQCAIVGNNTGAVTELGNNENMMISPDFEIKSLQECLEKVILDTNFMRRLQQNGYDTVSNLKNSVQFKLFENELLSLYRR